MSPLPDNKILNRARGCAVGAAVGDALGMSLEFGPPTPADRLVREMLPARGLTAGSFTDDTEMALALAESLLAQRPLDPDDLAQRFAAWHEAGPPDIGVHTRTVLSRIARGLAWREACETVKAEHPEAAGNGSVMRCWPVALAHWDSLEALQRDSTLQSEVTHLHPDCVAACVLVNSVTYHLLRGAALDDAFEQALTAALLSPDFAALLRAAPSRDRGDLKNSGWVRHTLETATWALFTTSSFEETVVQAANLGNDADTAASVTGAIAGAVYGVDGIPARWRAALRGPWPIHSDTPWRASDFERLAENLVRREGRA